MATVTVRSISVLLINIFFSQIRMIFDPVITRFYGVSSIQGTSIPATVFPVSCTVSVTFVQWHDGARRVARGVKNVSFHLICWVGKMSSWHMCTNLFASIQALVTWNKKRADVSGEQTQHLEMLSENFFENLASRKMFILALSLLLSGHENECVGSIYS